MQAIYPPQYHTKVHGGKINMEAPSVSTGSVIKRSSDWTEDGEDSWKFKFTAILDKIEHLPAV